MNEVTQKEPSVRDTFQARLDERLQQAAEAQITAQLGVLIGNRRFLIRLEDAGEVVALSGSITAVPNTRSWMLGLTNLRGVLHAVTDLGAFMGGTATSINKDCRLIAVSVRFGVNSALLVGRMLGLQNPAVWSALTEDQVLEAGLKSGRVGYIGKSWRDSDGRIWQELRVADLMRDDQFLKVQR